VGSTSRVLAQRLTAEADGEFVVFLIGMRINPESDGQPFVDLPGTGQPREKSETTGRPGKPQRDELRPEYDFSTLQGGVRGKYFKRAMAGTNLVLLDPDVARVFRDAKSVNQTLRRVAGLGKKKAGSSR
jgi:hypothetical protein